MLERACLAVEQAAEGGGVFPEVLFEVARHWHEMADEAGAANPNSDIAVSTPQQCMVTSHLRRESDSPSVIGAAVALPQVCSYWLNSSSDLNIDNDLLRYRCSIHFSILVWKTDLLHLHCKFLRNAAWR
jgi:hypothetical protein